MTWIYKCGLDNKVISADTKEQLVDKVLDHANEAHDMHMTRDQAAESVNNNAQQAA